MLCGTVLNSAFNLHDCAGGAKSGKSDQGIPYPVGPCAQVVEARRRGH